MNKPSITDKQAEKLVDEKATSQKGYAIFCIDKDKYEVERIDDSKNWREDVIVPQLENDSEAKALAILDGFEFENDENPFLVTGKH